MTEGFVTLTALADGHDIAVQRTAVRVLEDETEADGGARVKHRVRVTLADGTQFLVRGSVAALLEKMQTEK